MNDDIKYKILKDKKIGRYLISNRDLEKGALIFCDIPFAIGPKPDTVPVCLGCHSQWNGVYFCSKCGWPCCNRKCEKKDLHREYECKVFSDIKEKFQKVDITQPAVQYDCITPLRVLLAKEKDPERWEIEVSVMEDHGAERQQRVTWNLDQNNIINYLRLRCKLGERFSEHLIQKVCGILEVNAVEVPCQKGPDLRAIYPKVGIMSHNCVPTVVHTIISSGESGTPNNFAQVWSAADIKKGSKLEMCYTNVLHSTMQRRQYLRHSKFFDCDCDRCADPTEFGTNMSTMNCNYCESGMVLPKNPLDKETDWFCNSCSFSTTSAIIKKTLQVMEQEISEAEQRHAGRTDIEQQEQTLKWCHGALYKTHSFLTSLKYSLAQLYGNVAGYSLDELPVALLERKVKMCYQVIEILDIISPGYTRMRGMLLYELYGPLIKLAKIEYINERITDNQFKEKKIEISKLLHESGEILKREDKYSEKGKVGIAALKAYQDLLSNL